MTVKELRLSKGMDQEAFADSLGITRQAINNYENGKNGISKKVMVRIREVYGVEVAPVEIRERIW